MRCKPQKTCKHCGEKFSPDYRSAGRQQYCSKPACRKASKAESQHRWLAKNSEYFKGSANVARVQAWRKVHPDYWKNTQENSALQDSCKSQAVENNQENDFVLQALQEICLSQPYVFIGFFANLTTALQDPMAQTSDHLRQLGHNIVNGLAAEGGKSGKTTAYSLTSSPDPPAI